MVLPYGGIGRKHGQLSNLTGEAKYADYAARNYDFVFSNSAYFEKLYKENVRTEWAPLFAMNELDACGALAAGLADVNLTAKRADYTAYLKRATDYVSTKQVRLADRTLVRPGPRRMTLWADDLYMSVPLLARMGKITGNQQYFDDAIMQVDNFNNYLYDSASGLFIHCYYTDVNKQG